MAYNVNVNGTWHPAKKVSANVGGTWVDAKQAWVNVNGVWQSVYQSSLAPFNLVTSLRGSWEDGLWLLRYTGNAVRDTSYSFTGKVGTYSLHCYGSNNYTWQLNCWQNSVNGGILPKLNAYYFIRFYSTSNYNGWKFGYTNNGSTFLELGSGTNLVELGTVYRYNSSSPTYFKIATGSNISTDSASALYPRLFYSNYYPSAYSEGGCYVDQLYVQEISATDYNTKTFAELDAMYPWY